MFLYNIGNIFMSNQYLTHYWLMFPFYTILKASENMWLSHVFRGYRKRKSGSNGLKMVITGTKSFFIRVWSTSSLIWKNNSHGTNTAHIGHWSHSSFLTFVLHFTLWAVFSNFIFVQGHNFSHIFRCGKVLSPMPDNITQEKELWLRVIFV